MSYPPPSSDPPLGPLPPGWIEERNPQGIPYYVNTYAQNPVAQWEDPRKSGGLVGAGAAGPLAAEGDRGLLSNLVGGKTSQQSNYNSSGQSPYPQASQPPSYNQSGYNAAPYPQQGASQQYYQGSQSPYPATSQPYNNNANYNQSPYPQQQPQQQQYYQASPAPSPAPSTSSANSGSSNKNNLMYGAGGLAAGAMAMGLFEKLKDSNHHEAVDSV
ncbi:hypothetical protein MNV49_000642 [Pseudohyphozyma bogoriensis]|nr:hypothetical protein MNV49_000642 [Pseudohyphozyma bogoriensis]